MRHAYARNVCAALLSVTLSGCAHERFGMAAKALGCPEDSVRVMADAPERHLAHPHEHTSQETAAAAGTAALGALANAVGYAPASDPAFYLPANGVMLMAPGWRQYEGCNKAMICFDGGICARAEDPEAVTLARLVPGLMAKSAAEDPVVPGCDEPAYADRRGVLSWTLMRCNHLRVCTAGKTGYACKGEEQPGR
jgi:hypothetical protein